MPAKFRVSMGDDSPEAMFSWYLDNTPLEKVRTLATTQKWERFPTLTSHMPRIKLGWVNSTRSWWRGIKGWDTFPKGKPGHWSEKEWVPGSKNNGETPLQVLLVLQPCGQ